MHGNQDYSGLDSYRHTILYIHGYMHENIAYVHVYRDEDTTEMDYDTYMYMKFPIVHA